MLTACGETTLPDTSEQNPVDNTQETPLPESCQLYYDLGDASVLAEDKSLPLAQNAVFRGGTFETDQWDSTVVPTFILSGGDATCTDWLPQGTSIEVGASTMTANGIRYWDTVHVYDGGKIVDLMDETCFFRKAIPMEQQTLSSVTIRPITAADDPFIARIIRTNFEQYHLNIPGTAYFDPELDHLSAFYSAKPGRGYFVAVDENGTVLGGCGYAETAVFDRCAELQKLYLSDAAKGKRVGRRLSETVEQAARDAGYEKLYLETHSLLDAAIRLYEKLGFQPIPKPQGVQHSAMDHFYLKSL